MRAAVAILMTGALLACVTLGDASRPIPTSLSPAAEKARRLVVVLPGFGDGVRELERTGMVKAIQSAWPDSDVVLTGLARAYYAGGQAARRLHDEVIAPARQQGYDEVWLCGASMGGLGVLLYDAMYPGDVNGMVLLAPFLGERALLSEIAAAGGLRQWNPGPGEEFSHTTWQRELWRHIQTWTRDPALTRHVWVAYGDADRLREAMPLLESALQPGHVLVRPGGHAWSVWVPATREILVADRLGDAEKKGTP